MKFLHIDPAHKSQLPELVTAIKSGKPVFVLFFMEGCGHCVAMRPEWAKLKTAGADLGDVTIAAVDSGMLDELNSNSDPKVKNVTTVVNGFPTIKFVRGSTVVDYDGERTVDSFKAFIKSHMGSNKQQGGRRHRRRSSRSSRRHRSTMHRRRSSRGACTRRRHRSRR